MQRFSIAILLALGFAPSIHAAERPNVLIVITDDQGFGDLGAHGNPIIKTPNLDTFAKESAWLKNFYVCPVCSPTRSSLLTGRYNYRTGVVDTFIGRSLMRPEEVTLAERLADAGYRTGLFGKWHLGDNYPMRPEDQGFHETLWSQGGGLAQPSDPPEVEWKNAYFDPVLKQNGKQVKTKGYCTDVFTDAALDFIKTKSEKPFFAYVAYNAPHGPYQVPDELAAPYRKLDLTANGFPKIGQPWATGKVNTEAIARAYGMIENIDTNFGKLLKAIPENTIVIFLTDNGPGDVRFNSGLRNRKGTVYEGGIRVPCYVGWKAKMRKGGKVYDEPLAHIDVVPTILDACKIEIPDGLDGQSFYSPLFSVGNIFRSERTLFFQWHRGDVPEKYRAFAARGFEFKLVQANGSWEDAKFQPKYELFDIEKDPFEEKDLAAEKPDEVKRLKKEYEKWFDDVTKKGFDPPRIIIGNEKEKSTRLSRQDWRGPKAGWTPESEGQWEVKFERGGKYRATLISKNDFTAYTLDLGSMGVTNDDKSDKKTQVIEVEIPAGERRVSAYVISGKVRHDVDYLVFEYLGK